MVGCKAPLRENSIKFLKRDKTLKGLSKCEKIYPSPRFLLGW